MTEFVLDAQTRGDHGRRASRRLRRDGRLPAVVYGDGRPAQGVSLEERQVRKLLEDERVYSHVIELKMDGGGERVIIRDLQMHPYKASVLHMDFLRVHAGERITLHVPVHFINEDTCLGVRAGGVLHHAVTELEVEAPVDRLPEAIEVDVGSLGVGEGLHLSHIPFPTGISSVALKHGDDKEVVSVHAARTAVEEGAAEAPAA